MEILTEYNKHWVGKDVAKGLAPRPAYVKKLLSFTKRREVVAIQGIRRSGKSSLLKLFIRELLENGIHPQNILFLSFEDYRLGHEKSIELVDSWIQHYLQKMNPRGDKFLLLDEIQEIPAFEKWVRTRYEVNPDYHVFLTGSSSSLLSGEFATLLTGRHFSLEVYPFSFYEFLHFYHSTVLKELDNLPLEKAMLSDEFKLVELFLKTYLYQGGFPEAVKHKNEQSNIALLQHYLEDVLFRDIAFRYPIRRMDILQKLALYLISNMVNEINITRVAAMLGISRKLLMDSMYYLNTAYLIFTISNFSFSLNERLNTKKPKKVYCIDNGFFSAIKQTATEDVGKRVENTVFLHLKVNWKEEIFYWKGKVEIDFVLGNGFPINVTIKDDWDEREINGLLYFMTQFNIRRGILITWNKFTAVRENDKKIQVLPLWLFLLKSKQEISELVESE